jgi:hypothetical protein
MNVTDTITPHEGYEAMRLFLEAVSRRLGQADAKIEFFVGGLTWADGSPVDPTLWQDWLAAVEMARRGRTI